jgi:hypothetical protein
LGSTLNPAGIDVATGTLIGFTNQNCAQFDPLYCQYDNSRGAILYATTPTCPDASYTIELQTTNGNHIKTIVGSTSNGEISEHWDLTDDNGNTITNDSIKAVFNVTLLDPGSSIETLLLNRMIDEYQPVDGDFTVAYCYSENNGYDDPSLHDCMQLTVVDQLIGTCNATFCYDHPYQSTFNTWSDLGTSPGNPGHIGSQTDMNLLLTNLANVNLFQNLAKNFYYFGHAYGNQIGTGDGTTVMLKAHQVADALENDVFTYGMGHHLKPGILRLGQAYRFVFLDGCSTATDAEWAHAFGIRDKITAAQLANWPEQAQAFVGWTGLKNTPTQGNMMDMANCYTVFWSAWQSGLPLDRCIWYASRAHPPAPLNFEDLSAYNFGYAYQFNSPDVIKLEKMTPMEAYPRLRIYGCAGLTRTGYQPGYDNSIYYK